MDGPPPKKQRSASPARTPTLDTDWMSELPDELSMLGSPNQLQQQQQLNNKNKKADDTIQRNRNLSQLLSSNTEPPRVPPYNHGPPAAPVGLQRPLGSSAGMLGGGAMSGGGGPMMGGGGVLGGGGGVMGAGGGGGAVMMGGKLCHQGPMQQFSGGGGGMMGSAGGMGAVQRGGAGGGYMPGCLPNNAFPSHLNAGMGMAYQRGAGPMANSYGLPPRHADFMRGGPRSAAALHMNNQYFVPHDPSGGARGGGAHVVNGNAFMRHQNPHMVMGDHMGGGGGVGGIGAFGANSFMDVGGGSGAMQNSSGAVFHPGHMGGGVVGIGGVSQFVNGTAGGGVVPPSGPPYGNVSLANSVAPPLHNASSVAASYTSVAVTTTSTTATSRSATANASHSTAVSSAKANKAISQNLCPVSPAPLYSNSDPPTSSSIGATAASAVDPLSNQERAGSGVSNQEKRRNVQEQLALLLHAHRCQRKDQQLQHAAAGAAPGGTAAGGGGGGSNGVVGTAVPHCVDPKCSSMKLTLKHMTECQEGKSCKVGNCAMLRQIISHWKNCVRADCPICSPLKNASITRQRSVAMTTQPPATTTSSSSSVAADTVRAWPGGNGGAVTSAAGGRLGGADGAPTKLPEGGDAAGGGARLDSAPDRSDMKRTYETLGIDPANDRLHHPAGVAAGVGGSVGGRGGVGFGEDLIGAGGSAGDGGADGGTAGRKAKEWHRTVALDLRNHLVHKLYALCSVQGRSNSAAGLLWVKRLDYFGKEGFMSERRGLIRLRSIRVNALSRS